MSTDGSPSSSKPAGSSPKPFNPVLDTSGAKRDFWLVKVPDFVYEKWTKVQHKSTVGAVRFHQSAPGKLPTIEVTLNRDPEDELLPAPPPREFKMRTKMDATQTHHILAESDEGNALYGLVQYKCDLLPVVNSEFLEYSKMRTAEVTDYKQTVLHQDDKNKLRVGFVAPQKTTHFREKTKKASLEALQARTERMPESELMDLLFDAFEKYAHWNLRGLVQYTHQPQTYVREVLAKLCDYSQSGPFKSLYHLKSEYRVNDRFSKAEPAAPAEEPMPLGKR